MEIISPKNPIMVDGTLGCSWVHAKKIGKMEMLVMKMNVYRKEWKTREVKEERETKIEGFHVRGRAYEIWVLDFFSSNEEKKIWDGLGSIL